METSRANQCLYCGVRGSYYRRGHRAMTNVAALILVSTVSNADAFVAAYKPEALNLIQGHVRPHLLQQKKFKSSFNFSDTVLAVADAEENSPRKHEHHHESPDAQDFGDKKLRRHGKHRKRRKLRHFRLIEFARKLLHERVRDAQIDHEEPAASLGFGWPLCFFIALAVLFLLTREICGRLEVTDRAFDSHLSVAPGRPWSSYYCAVLVLCLATAVFWITVVRIHMLNKDIAKAPEVIEPSPEGPVRVTRYPITEPGRKGFEAGQGVFLSVAMGCILTCFWRWRSSVQISTPLLGQFALRGATLALAMAIALELIGEAVLRDAGVDEEDGYPFGHACMMLIVGASEEGAKLFAVLFGTWIRATAATSDDDLDIRSWLCLIVDSPRALMLAGLAVGSGFMVNENAEYMIAVVTTPPIQDNMEDAYDAMAILTIIVRVFLNIHPWWTGLSAARLARVIFKDGRDTAWPTLSEFLMSIAPSAVAHASYDFLVGANTPSVIAMSMPPLFWFGAREAFAFAWRSWEDHEICPRTPEDKPGKPTAANSLQGYDKPMRRGSAALKKSHGGLTD